MALNKPISVVKYSEAADNRDTFLLQNQAQPAENEVADKITVNSNAIHLLSDFGQDK